jgi:cell division protein FtsA
VTSLDIGTTKVCAIIAEVLPDVEPNIIGVGVSPCTGLQKGTVVDLEATTSAIRDAVKKAERMADAKVDTVLVGITGQHIASFNSRSVVAISNPSPREINERDIERLLEASRVIVLPPERQIVHSIPRWYSVDGQAGVRQPVGMYGSRLEVETHIVTGLSSFISNVVKCVQAAGLDVEATILEPIATGESTLLPEERALGVALVDIGGGTTDIAVYLDGAVYYSAAIPVGGNHVTKDIAVGLCTTQEEAERVKVRYGWALVDMVPASESFEVFSLGRSEPRVLPKRVLAEIIEPRMSEICELVMEQLEKAGCEDRVPAGIVFTGGASQIKGLVELSSRVTGLPVRLGKPFGVSGSAEVLNNPSYATAVGMLLFWRRNSPDILQAMGYGDTWLSRIVEILKGFLAKVGGDFKFCC